MSTSGASGPRICNQLRIVGEVWPEPIETTAAQAHELAALLGEHHDLAVLAEDLSKRREVGERRAFRAAIERRQEELLECALGIGRRLYAEKPKAFGRRLGAYWSIWREACPAQLRRIPNDA
jgi:hypothetical protein